jgi:hypothetical protein
MPIRPFVLMHGDDVTCKAHRAPLLSRAS